MFEVDHVALGECPELTRSCAHELRHDRPLLRQLSAPAGRVALDIDDTVSRVHSHKQLALLAWHIHLAYFYLAWNGQRLP